MLPGRRLKLRKGIIWAVIIILLVGLTQVLLPPILENRVERSLKERLTEADYLKVDIQAWPALASLLGRFHLIRIEARDFVVDKLPVGAFLVEGRKVQLNTGALYHNGQLLLENAADLRLTVLFTEEGINQYFWEQVDPQRRFHISLTPEGAELEGAIVFFGQQLDLTLRGVFDIRDQTRLIFIPEALSVEKVAVPQVLLKSLVEDKALIMDLAGLPIPLVIDEIRIETGQLYAFGHYKK